MASMENLRLQRLYAMQAQAQQQQMEQSMYGLGGAAAGLGQALGGLQNQQREQFYWSSGTAATPTTKRPKTFREELQKETDEWLKD